MIETCGASRIRPLGLAPSSSRANTPPEGWEVLKMPTAWRRVGRGSSIWMRRSKDFRMPSIARTLVEKEKIGEPRGRTGPERVARERSHDARRRGL
jgi:hypothetical protein